ncbi:MAG TPA: acetolactate synthase large subunit, partial [Acidimicrobiaceae bacterium]|nr:acetolactate synthase large subunit [Acidimicrobiaceae bacterium]
ERFSEVFLSKDVPDYKMWAQSMGCEAMRVDDPDEIDDVITRANEIDDRPVVIDFRIMAEEKVYPMVPSGATNSDLVVPPSQTDLPR